MHSAIYKGRVRHRRFSPRSHAFTYDVFMVYLDLDELDRVFAESWCWSATRPAIARFRRRDFFDQGDTPLADSVRDHVLQQTGRRPRGPIRLLANLRYFGYIMNPITCYYCFDESGQGVETIVAEVNNTPWNQRHRYVLNCDPGRDKQRLTFGKTFHVSPFQPMDTRYLWLSNCPGKTLALHMENFSGSERFFDATLTLNREEISAASLRRVLWQYPFMTGKVVGGIYWQALKLFMKRIPFYGHPESVAGKS
ncbi:DUF1365 domain-containing protein [Exilibacterium tricleocarpae]|uniref:DUF1365 domain-containing protein n=1 Tax=Exilibacterium tricleocarpae TaxID=2591008 RepID=A0A545TSL0_9GAMM|nr:DUF1365 domain-containing protein [Exilibacterium tricleocarpae]